MPYLIFQGDYALFALLFVTLVTMAIVNPATPKSQNLFKLAVAALAVPIIMGTILVNGIQYELLFFKTVVENEFSPNPLDTFFQLDITKQIWLLFVSCLGACFYSFVAFVLGGVLSIFLVDGTRLLLRMCGINIGSNECNIPILFGLMAVTYIAIFASDGLFVHGSTVRYIAGTPAIDSKISSRLAEYCGWRDVVTISDRFVSCGAELDRGVASGLRWSYGHGFGGHNTDEELIIKSSWVHLKDSGLARRDFVIELTWNDKGEALMLYTFDKNKTPPAIYPQGMDRYAESTLHELGKVVERLPDSRGNKVIKEMGAVWKHRELPEVR